MATPATPWRSAFRFARAALVVGASAAAGMGLAACGSADTATTQASAVVGGPGMLTTSPPWPAQYDGIKRRAARLKLPSTGSEKFHIHQLLHIYDDGILVPVAANIGVDERHHVELALHTHDSTGVIHMEAGRPFSATLGDLFTVWGVSFGPDRIGGLRAADGRPLRVFVNGRPVADPAAHRLRRNDNIVIAYGSTGGVPRVADTTPLRAVNGKGGAAVACSVAKGGQKPKSCFVRRKR